MRWFVLCLVAAGCARAGQDNRIVGGLVDAGSRDATVIPEPDGALDAPGAQVTLSQTTSTALALGSSFACYHVEPGNTFTLENSYYRVFTPSEHGIATTLHVTQVDFGIDTATGSGGDQPATVKIGAYDGTPGTDPLDRSLIRSIAAVEIRIPDGTGTRMTVPITGDVDPTARLIVELWVPDGHTAGHEFLIGVNADGERRPGYTRGPDCGVTDPATMQSIAGSIGRGETDLVLTVTGIR